MGVAVVLVAAQTLEVAGYHDTPRVADLRRRVRAAMGIAPVYARGSERIAEAYMSEPLPVRKARALALKLSEMPTDVWGGQLFCGSLTLENPRTHYEPGKAFRGGSGGFPDYTTAEERAQAAQFGLTISSVFGHIVPDYPRLLRKGLSGILAHARAQRRQAQGDDERNFLDSVEIALQGVMDYATRLAEGAESEAACCRLVCVRPRGWSIMF
ncbi:MAG: pyruvate formate lyase family protein [Chloroflexota bacterium]